MNSTIQAEHTVRAYEEGDEAQILKMFGEVFGRTSSLEEWRWKYADNPYALPVATLAFSPEQALIAQYTMIPVKLNVMGKPVCAGQSVDTMVHRAHRREGLFERTANHCYERFAKQGGQLVFGFPNEKSYPGFMRRLSWKRICYLKEYSLRLGVGDIAKRISRSGALAALSDGLYRTKERLSLKLQEALLGKRQQGESSFSVSSTAPAGIDELWNHIRSYAVFSVWKDETYFKWRYDANPLSTFQYATLSQDGKIIALAVVTQRPDKTMMITELLVRDQQLMAARLLLNKIAQMAMSRGNERLAFIGTDAGFFDSMFEGFQQQTSFGLILCARAFGMPDLQDMLVQPGAWTITLGDTDIL